jgi:hypothetical protein
MAVALITAAAWAMSADRAEAQDRPTDQEQIERLIKEIDRLVEQLGKSSKPSSTQKYYGDTFRVYSQHRQPTSLLEIAPDGSVTLTVTETEKAGLVERTYTAGSLKEFIEKYPKLAETYGIGRRPLKVRLEATSSVRIVTGDNAKVELRPAKGEKTPEDKLDRLLKLIESIDERVKRLESQK